MLDLHERQIEAFGGTLGIRDQGLLESAIAMPGASFGGQFVHESLFEMAAAYAFHIAERRLDKAGLARELARLARPAE